MKPEKSTNRKYSILIIDSKHRKFYSTLSASLQACTFTIMANHQKACEFFFHSSIDLVILDHTPERPFLPFLEFFKSTKPMVPVIITTSFGSEELAVESFRCGARDYLKKPPMMDEFTMSIETALGINNGLEKKYKGKYFHGMSRSIAYIHEHFTKKIDLSIAAREAGMSISCFERTFKKKTGLTFTNYINILRVTRAQELLKDETLSMSDIAFACGFTNQFHFSRTFKKFNSVSPSVLKKTILEYPTV